MTVITTLLLTIMLPSKTQVWKNQGFTDNWVKLNLEGKMSNRDGIGTKIEYYLGNEKYFRQTHCGIGFLSQNSGTEILGIGGADKIDTLRITWTSGLVESYYDLTAGNILSLVEGGSGKNSFSLGASQSNCNGVIKLSGGIYGREVSYEWSTGQNSRSIEVMEPGIYSVLVSTPVGDLEQSIQLEPEQFLEPISLSISTTPQTDNFGNGTAAVEISGGVGPFTIEWDDLFHQTGPTAQDLNAGIYTVKVTDQNGCQKSGTAVIDRVTGLEDGPGPELSVYPNPARDRLKVILPSSVFKSGEITLADLTGRKLFHWSVAAQTNGFLEFDINSIPQGMYLLTFQQGDNTPWIRKVMIR